MNLRHERAARQWLGKWKAAEVELENLAAKTRKLNRARKALLRGGPWPDFVNGKDAADQYVKLSIRADELYERRTVLTEKRDRYMRSFALLMREELER